MMEILCMAWPLARTHVSGRRRRWLLWLGLGALLLLVFVLCVHPAYAASATVGTQTQTVTLFDPIVNDVDGRSQTWFSIIQGLVQNTFIILGTIEICWAAAIWALEKDNLNSLAVEIIKKIMFIGFFYALLQYAPQWIPAITSTFEQVGETAGGTGPVSTDDIVATGLAAVDYIWSMKPNLTLFNVWGHLPSLVVAAFVSLGVIICFVIVAAQYFVLKVESYILFAAGAIFLGLGSSSWTKEYVSKYLNYAINVGVRLLVLILAISLMDEAVRGEAGKVAFDVVPLLKLLAVVVLECILAQKAPELAGSLMSGGAGMTAGSAMSGAMSTFGGVKNALGTMAGAVGAVAATAARTAQGVGSLNKAVSAGGQLAQQQGKTGTAAKLSGLGMALGQVARELPASMVNLVKGKGASPMGGRGQNPGPVDRAQQSLQNRLADAGAAASLSGSAPGPAGSGSNTGAAASSKLASGSSSSGGGGGGGGGGGTGGGMTPGIGGGMSGDIARMETAAKAAELGLSADSSRGGGDVPSGDSAPQSSTGASPNTSPSLSPTTSPSPSSTTDSELSDSIDTASSGAPSYSGPPSYASSPPTEASGSRPPSYGSAPPSRAPSTTAPANRPNSLRKAATPRVMNLSDNNP